MALLNDYSQGRIRQRRHRQWQRAARWKSASPPLSTPRRPPARAAAAAASRLSCPDPGHGGGRPGAIGPSGLREKDVVLAIARETKKRLDAMGYRTYMTRNEDVFIPLGVRVAKARSLKADLLCRRYTPMPSPARARAAPACMRSAPKAPAAPARPLFGANAKQRRLNRRRAKSGQ